MYAPLIPGWIIAQLATTPQTKTSPNVAAASLAGSPVSQQAKAAPTHPKGAAEMISERWLREIRRATSRGEARIIP
jgi:hypothetical protein